MGQNTVRHSGFPLGVLFLLALFLLVQDRIDRRDPKLALAPEYPEPDVPFPASPRGLDDPAGPAGPADPDDPLEPGR
jgi:hypothetical protein